MAVSTETSTRTTWVHFVLSLMAPCTIPLNPYAGCIRPHTRLPRVTVTRGLSYRKEVEGDHSVSPPSEGVDLGRDDTERVSSEPSVTGWSEVAVIIGTMPSLLGSRRGEGKTRIISGKLRSVTYTSNMKTLIVCRHRTALRAQTACSACHCRGGKHRTFQGEQQKRWSAYLAPVRHHHLSLSLTHEVDRSPFQSCVPLAYK